jgi:oligopeptide transport system substrate-binding protein
MSTRGRSVLARLLVVLLAMSLVAAACSDDDDDPEVGGSEDVSSSEAGGEVVDLGTFAAGAPESLDPALNNNVEAYSVINALYDGLTDVDASDPNEATVQPLVAESYEVSDDGLTYTFTIREDAEFSNGEAVLPSSFVRGWERASDPELAGPYSNLFALIEGGQAKLDGEADSISGVTADDDERTLTVELAQPYASFDVVSGFQVFYPMPEAVEELEDQSTWGRTEMIGNGPFKLDGAPGEREIVLVRNDRWGGSVAGAEEAMLDKITFKVSESVDAAFDAFEAKEGDVGPIPPDRAKDVEEQYGNTLDVALLSSYMFQIGWEDPVLGGKDNAKLREAISLAIDREEINEAVYSGSRIPATGITPPGIPGFERGICKFCERDLDAAKDAFEAWQAEGNRLTEPIKLQVNADAGHEDALQLMVDHLQEIGIEAVAETPAVEAYQELLGSGGCVICRWNWVADYPTYDNFLFDNFHSSSAPAPNFGNFADPAFDELVDEGRATRDPAERAELFRKAEDLLLNEDVAAIPMFWGRGGYAYDETKIDHFVQTNFGLVLWEEVTKKS